MTWGSDDPLYTDLLAAVQGDVTADADLSSLTTLGVGGRARALVVAESAEDLQAISHACAEHAVGWLVIGRGSNLLIAEDGFDGVAIRLGRGFRGVQIIDPGSHDVDGHIATGWLVVAGSAEPMPVLANNLEKQALAGMEFGVAIPGTVGGAVRMNAGAHGGQMADVLAWAEVVRLRSGAMERWHPEQLQMRYRHTALPDDAVVVRACLRVEAADVDTLAADMDDMRRWRREHQPINQRSCGSVFRNPPGDSAGRLIDAAGLKGYRVGDAEVSPKHANFITAGPAATADDVWAIITHCQDEVRRQFDVELEPEVVVVGYGRPEGAG